MIKEKMETDKQFDANRIRGEVKIKKTNSELKIKQSG